MRGPLLPISTPRLMALEWSGALGTAIVFFVAQLEDQKGVDLDGVWPFVTPFVLLGAIAAILGPLLAILLACPGVPSKRERRVRLGATLAMLIFVYAAGLAAASVVLVMIPDRPGPQPLFYVPR